MLQLQITLNTPYEFVNAYYKYDSYAKTVGSVWKLHETITSALASLPEGDNSMTVVEFVDDIEKAIYEFVKTPITEGSIEKFVKTMPETSHEQYVYGLLKDVYEDRKYETSFAYFTEIGKKFAKYYDIPVWDRLRNLLFVYGTPEYYEMILDNIDNLEYPVLNAFLLTKTSDIEKQKKIINKILPFLNASEFMSDTLKDKLHMIPDEKLNYPLKIGSYLIQFVIQKRWFEEAKQLLDRGAKVMILDGFIKGESGFTVFDYNPKWFGIRISMEEHRRDVYEFLLSYYKHATTIEMIKKEYAKYTIGVSPPTQTPITVARKLNTILSNIVSPTAYDKFKYDSVKAELTKCMSENNISWADILQEEKLTLIGKISFLNKLMKTSRNYGTNYNMFKTDSIKDEIINAIEKHNLSWVDIEE